MKAAIVSLLRERAAYVSHVRGQAAANFRRWPCAELWRGRLCVLNALGSETPARGESGISRHLCGVASLQRRLKAVTIVDYGPMDADLARRVQNEFNIWRRRQQTILTGPSWRLSSTILWFGPRGSSVSSQGTGGVG
jgi:hypothetical protein